MDIPGYEELYLVDTSGNVFGVKRNKFLKPRYNTFGYHKVSLCKNGKLKPFSVHRLVAMTYIPNSNNLPKVNHINKIRDDNRVENLEWCTQLYNTQSKNTSKSIGNIQKHFNKYVFKITVNKKLLYYSCPNEYVALGMRSIYTDLL